MSRIMYPSGSRWFCTMESVAWAVVVSQTLNYIEVLISPLLYRHGRYTYGMLGTTRSRTALLLLFVILFAFWWGVSIISQKTPPAPIASPQTTLIDNRVAFSTTSPIIVHYSVDKNTHTYSGTLMLPSSCDTLGTGVTTSGSEPIHISILLSVLRSTSNCHEGPGDAEPFSVSISSKAKSAAPLFDGVTVNSAITSSTLVETK